MTVEKGSLLVGLKQLRGGQGGADLKPAPTPPAPRTAATTRFVTVDPDAHRRSVDAQRAELARQRDLDDASYLLAQRDSDMEESRRTSRGRGVQLNAPTSRPQTAAKPKKAAAPRDPYAHLHADALSVWRCIAEHLDLHGQPPTMLEIADALTLTVSTVSHRLRQLENNAILRRGYDGVIVLCIRPETRATVNVPTAETTIENGYVLKPETVDIWRFLAQYIDEHGYAPSLRDIGEACACGLSVTSKHLDRLEAAGVLRRSEAARSIQVLIRPDKAWSVRR